MPTIKSMDTEGRVIYAGSFSKVMAPAFRLGFLVFNKSLTGDRLQLQSSAQMYIQLYFSSTFVMNILITMISTNILRIQERCMSTNVIS